MKETRPCPTCGGSGVVQIAAIPEPLKTDEFTAAWAEWVAFRTQKRQKLTDITIRRQFKVLEAMGPEKAVRSIEASITNGWTGLFDPDVRGGKKPINIEEMWK